MRYRTRIIRLNPKPIAQLTDRAKRYRAQKLRPPGRKQCNYCGRRKNVGIDHVNGLEEDLDPRNLVWACKRCNAVKANLLKNAGLGRRVRQYNPRMRKNPSKAQMDEYAAAIKVMRGEFEGNVAKAVDTIRATPASVRSAYTSRTWPTRRAIYGPSGRQTDLPF